MLNSSDESGHLCLTTLPTFPGYTSTFHLFLLASSAQCTGFRSVDCLSNLFPFVSVHVIAFSILLFSVSTLNVPIASLWFPNPFKTQIVHSLAPLLLLSLFVFSFLVSLS